MADRTPGRARLVQQLVLDRVNRMVPERDRLEIRGDDRTWGVFRRTDPDTRGPGGATSSFEHTVDPDGRGFSGHWQARPGYSRVVGSGIGTWIPFTPHPVRVKLALIDALEEAADVLARSAGVTSVRDWPGPGAVATTRLRRDRVEVGYRSPVTGQRWDLDPVLLAGVPRR